MPDGIEVNRSEEVVAPQPVFYRLALLCAAGTAIVTVLAHGDSPLRATVLALSLQALICIIAARTPRESQVRSVAIITLAASTAVLGYLFGPNSAFAAVLVIVLALTGMLSTTVPERAWVGWSVLAAISGGQIAVMALVMTATLADRSLSPMFTAHPVGEIVAAHLLIQGVYFLAFVAGRSAQRRYRRLVTDIVQASRRAVTREALVEEAKADYARAVALRESKPRVPATSEGPTLETALDANTLNAPTDANTLDPPTRDRTARSAQPVGRISTSADERPARDSRPAFDEESWQEAFQSKLRGQDAYTLALCLAGGVFSGIAVHEALPRAFAIAAIGGITALIALRAVISHFRPSRLVTWPWDVIGLLSVGVAYGFGLHSGFAAIIAMGLLYAGLFRTPLRLRNNYAIYSVCIGHAVVFAAIAAGLLEDKSNVRLWIPGRPEYEPYLHHLLLQATFVAAYVFGRQTDLRFAALSELARDAFRAYARADARLRVARAELDAQAPGEGIFTGTEVGPYKVGRLLGRGGMGEVYAAERDSARVALKLVRAERLGDPVALERFERESKMLLRIDGPYSARVIDAGRDAELPYLAMEHVDGPSLAAILRDRERLGAPELTGLVDDVAHGLADIHTAGVLHLDLKPSNILHGETPQGRRWRIVDFGVSMLVGSEERRSFAGTPQYMAPEQALEYPVDARADLYSLSLIVYRALTGRPAFTGLDRRAIAEAAEHGPPDPREVVSLDEDLALVLRIGLAARADDRFATADELRVAYIGALTGRLDERTRRRGRELLMRAPWRRA